MLNMFVPDMYLKSIYDIDYKKLKKVLFYKLSINSIGFFVNVDIKENVKITFFKRQQACRKSSFSYREKLRQAFKHNSYRKQYRKYFRFNFKHAFFCNSSCKFTFKCFEKN